MPAQIRVTSDPNYSGAAFSFLRVLVVGLAVAILPYIPAGGQDVDYRAILTAVASAFLLTVINFFRSGNTSFGSGQANAVVADDEDAV